MKTAELEREDLDYWVARAEVEAGFYTFDNKVSDKPLIQLWGRTPGNVFNSGPVKFKGLPGEYVERGPSYGEFEPSTDWSFGGPIIEREHICIGYSEVHGWGADFQDDVPYRWHGKTPLIAAMRAFVASKFGDEVEDITSC